MSAIKEIDVICQHNKDGSIIPLKIRLQDEDLTYQTYSIRSYKKLELESIRLPNESVVTTNLMRYNCIIEVFGQEKSIVLHYNKTQVKWYILY